MHTIMCAGCEVDLLIPKFQHTQQNLEMNIYISKKTQKKEKKNSIDIIRKTSGVRIKGSHRW
jgi:hypothetical protein